MAKTKKEMEQAVFSAKVNKLEETHPEIYKYISGLEKANAIWVGKYRLTMEAKIDALSSLVLKMIDMKGDEPK